jgi:hypothetical protein
MEEFSQIVEDEIKGYNVVECGIMYASGNPGLKWLRESVG